MLSTQDELDFKVLEALVKADFKEYKYFREISEVLQPIIGIGDYEILLSMHRRGLVDKAPLEEKYLITTAGKTVYKSLKKRIWAEQLDTLMKYVVGIVAILGTIATIILSVLSLRQQQVQENSKQELKQLTNERDSIEQVLREQQRLLDSRQTTIPTPDTPTHSVQNP